MATGEASAELPVTAWPALVIADQVRKGMITATEVLEAHLLDEDIPLAHRGMQGRVWRAKEGAAANRKKMDAMRARMKDLRASRKAAKADAKAQQADAKADEAKDASVQAAEAITHSVSVTDAGDGAAEGSD